jgi:hypothetical protein
MPSDRIRNIRQTCLFIQVPYAEKIHKYNLIAAATDHVRGTGTLPILTLVVAVSTFAILIFYLIANIAAFKLLSENLQYPTIVPVIGAVTCIVLIAFLTINSWIIGIIGLAMGNVWYAHTFIFSNSDRSEKRSQVFLHQ